MVPVETKGGGAAVRFERSQLHKVLPLDTPYSLHIFPSYYCNFKCSYCLHVLSPEELKRMSFKKQLMPFDVFKKALDDLMEFPKKLKALIIAGHGEPLIHKDIDKMVQYAKVNAVAERVEIVTNAALLTRELSDKLILAGVDRLRISVQGVTEEKYRDVAGVELHLDRFIENIRYFHDHRTHTEIYAKIIDIALENKEQETLFRTLFSSISDVASVEYAIPFVSQVDYSKFGVEFTKCKQGHRKTSKICAMPFYMLVLTPNGDVVPCCSVDIPVVYGNVMEESLFSMWNGSVKREFLHLQLENRNMNQECKKCTVPAYGLQEGDYLDDYSDRLINIYE